MHYVIGDPHGHYTDLMNLIKKLNLTSDDKVFIVGDILDRAPTVYEQAALIEWCENNITEDGQFQMVLGNHELEFMNRYDNVNSLNIDTYGGEMTEGDILFHLSEKDPYNLCDVLYRCNINPTKLWMWCKRLPLFKEVTVNDKLYIVTHAWLNIGMGQSAVNAYVKGDLTPDKIGVKESVWDRICNEKVWDFDCTVIHGHTPTSHMKCITDYGGKVSIQRGNINVDCGRYFGLGHDGNLAAYCIETGESIYLFDDKWFKSEIMKFSQRNYKLACILYKEIFNSVPDKSEYIEDTDIDAEEFLNTLDVRIYVDTYEYFLSSLDSDLMGTYLRYDFQ